MSWLLGFQRYMQHGLCSKNPHGELPLGLTRVKKSSLLKLSSPVKKVVYQHEVRNMQESYAINNIFAHQIIS